LKKIGKKFKKGHMPKDGLLGWLLTSLFIIFIFIGTWIREGGLKTLLEPNKLLTIIAVIIVFIIGSIISRKTGPNPRN